MPPTNEEITKLCDCHWQLENLAVGNHEVAALKRILLEVLELLVPPAARPTEWREVAAARANPSAPQGPATINQPAQFDAQGALVGGVYQAGGNTVVVRMPTAPSSPPAPAPSSPPAPPAGFTPIGTPIGGTPIGPPSNPVVGGLLELRSLPEPRPQTQPEPAHAQARGEGNVLVGCLCGWRPTVSAGADGRELLPTREEQYRDHVDAGRPRPAPAPAPDVVIPIPEPR